MSNAVRQLLGPEPFLWFQLLIAMGKSPIIVELEDGELAVVADEERGAMAPTLDQRIQAMIRLEQRGYGMPVQQVQLEAELRAHATSEVKLAPGAIPVGEIAAMRRARDEARAVAAAKSRGSVSVLPPATSAADATVTNETSADSAPVPADGQGHGTA